MSSDCVTLWIGERLGAVERACLRSILRQGHKLALYCYQVPAGVPSGVELRDASDILPESSVFRHHGGSVGPFADWFRYELQARGLGIWVDTDIYAVAPLDMQPAHLFGEQEPGVINNAVLRLPADSPMLPDLLRPFRSKTVPSWLPLRSYLPAKARELIRREADLSRLPWGSSGPDALTAVVRKHGLLGQVVQPAVFYPVTWEKAHWIRDPAITVGDVLTPLTSAIHLWNECIRGFKELPAPRGSFLHRLQEEGE